MDKKCLDFEFKRYVKVVQSYLVELVDIETVAACHAWLDKLSSYADTAQRNKYIFKLMYQLARGSLQEPFTRPPASEHLEIIPDGPDDKTDLSYPGADSLLPAKDKTTIGLDKSCETFTLSKENSNSERPDTLINMKTSNRTIEKRFKNIVIKLRQMKRGNSILHQLLSEQEKYKNNYCNHYFSENFRETTTNVSPHFFEPRAWQPNRDHNINDTKIKMESTVVKYLDLPKFNNETELEIINKYESKIFELTKQHSNSLDVLKQYYEKLLGQLQISHDNNINEKEGIIKKKDEEIARLKKSIEEFKTRTLCKKFSLQNIEQRLSKIETSTSKHLKKYQKKILKQRQKYICDCSLLLDLLQQKSNADGAKDDPVDPCTNHLKKLEDKYRNIVAKVQANALQRMIKDQLAMQTLVKKISSMSFVCNKTSQMNNVHNKTKSKIEDPKTQHEPSGVEVIEQTELKNNELKS